MKKRILVAPAHFTLGEGSGSESATATKIIQDLATAFDLDVVVGHLTGRLAFPPNVCVAELYPDALPVWTHVRRLRFLWDVARMARELAGYTRYAAVVHLFPFDHHHGSLLPFFLPPQVPLLLGPLTLPIDLLRFPDEVGGFAGTSAATVSASGGACAPKSRSTVAALGAGVSFWGRAQRGLQNRLRRDPGQARMTSFLRVLLARAVLPLTGFLSAATIHHARHVVAESKASRQYWSGIGEQENWTVIYNALERQFTVMKRPRRRTTTLISIGNLFVRKGMDRCIEVVHALQPRFRHPIRLLIVGDGPEKSRLLKMSNKYIQFMGRVPKEQMRSFYHRADLCLVLPRQEAFPNTAMEAMATGIPVVATDVGAAGEIVEDGKTGFLVPNDNLRLMVDRTAELVGDVALREKMGRAAERAVRLKFDERTIRNTWIQVIETSIFSIAP